MGLVSLEAKSLLLLALPQCVTPPGSAPLSEAPCVPDAQMPRAAVGPLVPDLVLLQVALTQLCLGPRLVFLPFPKLPTDLSPIFEK